MMKYVETSSTGTHSVGYTYDNINNLTKLVETIGTEPREISYTYDEDNRPTSISTEGASRNYIYDVFGRVSKDSTKQNDTEIFEGVYAYQTPTGGGTSNVLYGLSYDGASFDRSFMANRDANGNIHYSLEGTDINTYEYDSANQLIRENNRASSITSIWTYDAAGNILTRETYPYNTGTLDPAKRLSLATYTYDDDKGWGDLLTAYNGFTITHDEIGNPLNDGTWTYIWQHGRQLASMAKIDQSEAWQFTYNADGMRTQRTGSVTDPTTGVTTNRTYNYTYLGGQLTHMTVDGHTMYFAYDASGAPLSLTYDGVTYYYVTSLQGDVVSILDNTGAEVVRYINDAWGNPISTTGTLATTIGFYNPLRYRGYVYDAETELYYLQTRYYNPEMGRFINGDGLVSTGQGVLGNNMFAYCGNNPLNGRDPNGKFWVPALIVAGVVIGAIVINTIKNKIIDNQTEISKTEKELAKKYPFSAYKVKQAKETADRYTQERYPNNWGSGINEANAFRHAMWNAVMTDKIGAKKAKKFADAHEAEDLIDYPEECKMDYHNNQLGREIALAYPNQSYDVYAQKIQEAIEGGQAYVIPWSE